MANLPDFDSLPIVEGLNKRSAWGLWDKEGKKDVHGCLNILTPEVVKEAYKEARDGVSISLNWPLNSIKLPAFGRKAFTHNVINFQDSPGATKAHGYDDEVEFNTQLSSQWDSLCHYHHQETGQGYNGARTTVEELTPAPGKEDADGRLPTLGHWHKRGCLVGRGVFLDFRRWADAQGRKVDEFSDDHIMLEEIEAVAKYQGVEFRPGDIFILRSGFTEALERLSGDEQNEVLSKVRTVGVDGNENTARWFWNHHFSAVAGDMIAFEALLPKLPDGSYAGFNGLPLHDYFLGLFGLHIGELWDLKALSEHCAKTGRYTFLLTSAPLNYPGSVGSPPNAIAMF